MNTPIVMGGFLLGDPQFPRSETHPTVEPPHRCSVKDALLSLVMPRRMREELPGFRVGAA